MPSERDIVIAIRAQSSGLEQEFSRVHQSAQQLARGIQSTNGILQTSTATTSQLATSLGTIRPHAQTATGALGHLAQTSGQAATQLGGVRTQANTSSPAIRSVGQAAQTTAQQVRTMGTAASSTGGALSSGIASLKNYAAAYLSVQAAASAARAIFSAGLGTERLERAFTAIAGSAAAGKAELDFLRQTATRLGLDFDALANSYKFLSAASAGTTLEGQKTRQLFLDIVEASRALGLSSERTSLALRAVGQMMSTGTIQADELKNELGNHLPIALGAMAKAAGMNTRELMKLMEAGKAISEELLPKFGAQIRAQAVDGMTDAASGALALEQAFARMGNTLKAVMADVMKSPFFAEFARNLNLIREDIEKLRAPSPATAQTTADIASAAGGVALKPEALKAVQADIALIDTMIAKYRTLVANTEKLRATATDPAVVKSLDARLSVERAELAVLEKRRVAALDLVKTKLPELRATPVPAIDTSRDAAKKLATEQAASDKLITIRDTAIATGQELEASLRASGKSGKELAEAMEKYWDKQIAEVQKLTAAVSVLRQGAPPSQRQFFAEASQKTGVPQTLLEAIGKNESNFDPLAESKLYDKQGNRIPGAQGVMQIMPKTGEGLGLKDPLNAEQSIKEGSKYFRQMLQQFGTTELALAAYNWGPGNVERVGRDPSKFPAETQAYVKNVMATQQQYAQGVGPPAPGADTARQVTADFVARRDQAAGTVKGFDLQEDTLKGEADVAKAAADAYSSVSEEIADLSARFRENSEALAAGKTGMDQWERSTALARLTSLSAGEATTTLATDHDRYATEMATYTEGVKANTLAEKAAAQAYEQVGEEIETITGKLRDRRAELAATDLAEGSYATQAAKRAEDRVADLQRLRDLGAGPGTIAIAESNIAAITKSEDERAALEAGKAMRQEIQGYANSVTTIGGSVSGVFGSGAQLANEEARLRTLQAQLPEVERNSEAFRLLKREIAETRQNITEFSAASGKAWMDFAQTATEQILKLMETSSTFRDAMTSLFASIAEGLAKMVQGLSAGGGIDWSAILGTTVKVASAVAGGGSSGDIDFNREGGPIFPGQRTHVGEEGRELMITAKSLRLVGVHGPEIIRPPEAGIILPHQQTMTLLRRNAAYLTPPMMQATARQALATRRSTAEPLVGIPVPPVLRRSLPGVLAQWTPPGMAPAEAARAKARLMPQEGERGYETIIPSMARREYGGPVSQGGTYLTGEGGLELMLGAARTRGMGGPGGKAGGNTTNVHLHLHDVRDAPSFVRSRSQVARAMRGIVQDGGMGGDGR